VTGAASPWLARRAARTPGRLAVVCDEARLSFAGLDRACRAAAGRLRRAGVAPGDRVALWLEPGLGFVVAWWAVAYAGATAVPLNTRLTAVEAAWQVADAEPAALLFDAAQADRAGQAVGPGGPAAIAWEASVWAEEGAPGGAPADPAPEGVAAIVYTSGTTGRPKGALVTWANLWHNAAAQAMALGSREDDRWLSCLPMFHVSGLAMLSRCALFGLPLFVQPRFDPERVNAAIDADRITAVSVVATALERMLEARDGRPYPPWLRLVLSGGGPTPRALLERAVAEGVPVATTYGLTETASQAVSLAPADLPGHLGSAGLPLMPLDARIVGADGGTLPPDEIGEIAVRGPTVVAGYWRQPEATARAIRDGWLFTGDLGRLDADGYLFVADRREDLIVSGGENVYPAEVEAVLLGHPDVADAAVVGLADAQWGQAVAAAVVPAPGRRPDPEGLRRFAGRLLAGYKVPRRIRLVETLPRTASGKLRRGAVREGWRDDG